MLIHDLTLHDLLLKAVGHKGTRAVLTHTSVAGFGCDFFIVWFEKIGLHLPHLLDKVWIILREPTITYAALAGVLVIYTDHQELLGFQRHAEHNFQPA